MPRSTRSFLFPDINVWVALTYEGHTHHVAARNWFNAIQPDARLFFCRFTQLGLLRLLSAEAVMGGEAMNQAEAWNAYDRWLEDGRVTILDEPAELEPIFRGMSQLQRPSPKDWADSYLAAFATSAHLALVTFDQALHGKARKSLLLKTGR